MQLLILDKFNTIIIILNCDINIILMNIVNWILLFITKNNKVPLNHNNKMVIVFLINKYFEYNQIYKLRIDLYVTIWFN